jgi:hypothetical protein
MTIVSQECNHISINEQKQIVSLLKQHFGTNRFTYDNAKQLFPDINNRRLFRLLQKSYHNGFVRKVGTINIKIGDHRGYVKQYEVII